MAHAEDHPGVAHGHHHTLDMAYSQAHPQGEKRIGSATSYFLYIIPVQMDEYYWFVA